MAVLVEISTGTNTNSPTSLNRAATALIKLFMIVSYNTTHHLGVGHSGQLQQKRQKCPEENLLVVFNGAEDLELAGAWCWQAASSLRPVNAQKT